MISQTLFSSRKDSYPTYRGFFSLRAPSSCYFGISNDWPWMGVGVNIFWNCAFRLSQQEHQYLSWQSLIFSLDGPLIGTVHIVVLQYSSFLFKANCMCSRKQVAKFITVIYFCFASQGRACHCESFGTIHLTFDSLL